MTAEQVQASWRKGRLGMTVFVTLLTVLVFGFGCGLGWRFGTGMLDRVFFSCEHSGFLHAAPASRSIPFYTAQVTSLDCGATSPFDARVFLVTRSANTDEVKETVFEGRINPITVAIRWDSPTNLVVEYPQPEQARVRKQLNTWREITVTYVPK